MFNQSAHITAQSMNIKSIVNNNNNNNINANNKILKPKKKRKHNVRSYTMDMGSPKAKQHEMDIDNSFENLIKQQQKAMKYIPLVINNNNINNIIIIRYNCEFIFWSIRSTINFRIYIFNLIYFIFFM